jgi:hypothetical protein
MLALVRAMRPQSKQTRRKRDAIATNCLRRISKLSKEKVP